MDQKTFGKKIVRKAIVMDVGAFRPPENPISSWFGKVNFCAVSEEWPISNGKPMLPLTQINLQDLPYKPQELENISFLTVFIDSDNLPMDTENGDGWLIRTYESLDNLTPVKGPECRSHIKPFPMKAREIDEDYPCWEDLPIECPEELDEQYYDLFENVSGFKFGGWPSLIQSEIFWCPWNNSPSEPSYVFQIDTEPKAHWSWGDGGVGYFGLGKDGKWFLSWQCY